MWACDVTHTRLSHAQKRMLLQVPEQWAAAEREVRMHGQLQHRNILQLLDSELAGERSQHGTAYLLFPYCRVSSPSPLPCPWVSSPPPSLQYGTMQDLMERSRGNGEPLSERRILKLFVSVCRGLRAMHGCSTGPVAHRDVKVSDPAHRPGPAHPMSPLPPAQQPAAG